MTGSGSDPKWSLERRESSGHLVWRKEAPQAKVRFRFDVEVLEFEKLPHEDKETTEDKAKVNDIRKTITVCASCILAVAVSFLVPWFIMVLSSRA